jgi:hypothetical protein
MSTTHQTRACGGCTACCTALAIDDRALKKDRWKPCRYQRSDGCGIHDTKPRTCAAYHCLWLDGKIGTFAQRPDKLGLVPHLGRRESSTAPETLVLVAVAAGGSCTQQARAFIEHALNIGFLVQVHDRGLMPRLVYHAKRGQPSEPIGLRKQNEGITVVWHNPHGLLETLTKNPRAT